MKRLITFFYLLVSLLFMTQTTFAQPSGSALDFDGFDDLVVVEDDLSLDMTNGFTIAAWIYLDSYVEWASIVTKGAFFFNNYTIHQSGPMGGSDYGHLRFTGESPNLPIFLESNTQIPLEEWHYVAITYDGFELQFYLDGFADGGGILPGPLGTNDYPLFIGVDPPGGIEFWDGKIDEVRIWNIALKQTHIQAAMNGHAAPKASNLAGYWRFDEGQGDNAGDRSANNNTGFLFGSISGYGPTWTSPGAPIGNSSGLISNDHLTTLKNDVSQSFPNPFGERTTIQFKLDEPSTAMVRIFNLNGQELNVLANSNYPSGIHRIEWDGTDAKGNRLATGSYVYRIDLGQDAPSFGKIQILR